MTLHEQNEQVLQRTASFLNSSPSAIHAEDIALLTQGCGITEANAYAMLLAACCGLAVDERAEDRELFHRFFAPMVHLLEPAAYAHDPFLAWLPQKSFRIGSFSLQTQCYQPFEAFVCDDLLSLPDGRILPQLGYFREPFPYPAVLEEQRVWMTVTPNEINTMRQPIADSFGKVLALGLGLGYFACRAAAKDDVRSVTVVEQSADCIALFRSQILPRFPYRDKLRLVQADAFAFAAQGVSDYDYVFADLWHDVSDGLEAYQHLKRHESASPRTRFAYWIEQSLKCYLPKG